MEPSAASTETQQFDAASVSAPIANAQQASSGSYSALLNAGGSTPQPIGPTRIWPVQGGDTLHVSAYAHYIQPYNYNTWHFVLPTFVAGYLANPPAGNPDGASTTKNFNWLQVGLAAGLSVPSFGSGVPHAYLRLLVYKADSTLLLDRPVPISSAAQSSWEPLSIPRFVLPVGAAYAQVYVAEETNISVWFDDLTIEHWPGLQVQENHYDPFGLDLAGLSRSTPGLKALSQYQWNGKEKQADFGLGWTHLDWRFFDPQTGRFHAVDPLTQAGQESWSTYQFGYDNAVRYNDPDGRFPGGGPPMMGPIMLPVLWQAIKDVYNSVIGRTVTYTGNGPNDQVYTKAHPIDAARALRIANRAGQIAESTNVEATNERGDGSLTNAMRHGLGQAMATRDLGAGPARQAADAHEGYNAGLLQENSANVKQLTSSGQTVIKANIADGFVDLLNNQAGRQIGAANPGATDKQLANLTLQALAGNNDKLPALYRFTLNPDEKTATVTRTQMGETRTSLSSEAMNSNPHL